MNKAISILKRCSNGFFAVFLILSVFLPDLIFVIGLLVSTLLMLCCTWLERKRSGRCDDNFFNSLYSRLLFPVLSFFCLVLLCLMLIGHIA